MSSRHGQRADDKELLSISMERSLKDALRVLAARNRRVLSDYVRITLEDVVKNDGRVAVQDAADTSALGQLLEKRQTRRRPKAGDKAK